MSLLALGTAVLVVLAVQSPPTPEAAGTGVAPAAADHPTPQPTPTPAEASDLVVAFIGDHHLETWAPAAADDLGLDARVDSGVSLFGERQVTDALGDFRSDPPDVVVLSIGADDVVWVDDFQFGLTDAIETIEATWPESEIVLMPPAWPDPDDLQTEKIAIAEQVAQARGLTYLSAVANAGDFTRAWSATDF